MEQARQLPCEGERRKLCDINKLTRSMMTMTLGLGEDLSEDFNHGGHGRA